MRVGGGGGGGRVGTWHDKVTAVQHARLIPNPTFLSLSGLQLYGNHRPTLIGFPNLLTRMKQKLPSDYWHYFPQTQHSPSQPLTATAAKEWKWMKYFLLELKYFVWAPHCSKPVFYWLPPVHLQSGPALLYLGQFLFFPAPRNRSHVGLTSLHSSVGTKLRLLALGRI